MDSYARKFSYLRLSVTDICNFSCSYCLPSGYQKPTTPLESELSLLEIQNLLQGFALAGFTKVRFTGGEPTTRMDITQIIEAATAIGNYRKRALSTNAWNLKSIASRLKLSGLTHLNISVDSLNSAVFHRLTGRDQLPEVLKGIDQALALDFQSIKINAVLHRETASDELRRFMDFVKIRPVSVRFIELMKTRDHSSYAQSHFISTGEMKLKLLREGWTPVNRMLDDGPALEFAHPDFTGRIGIIAPHSEGFCDSCNRLRMTSRGKLRLCLFGEEDYSLRPWLQSADQVEEIPSRLQSLLGLKPESHFLHDGMVGQVNNFSGIGG